MIKILDKIKYRPKNSVVELTYSCNLTCKHCASDLNSDYERGEQLTVEEFESVFRELKELGGEHLVLSGGEALLHKDWEHLAKYAVGLGLTVSLISNGLIIDENIAKRIKDTGIGLVALSLDGLEEYHNFMRNNKNSYRKVLEAAKHIRNQGLKVNFITAVTRGNLKDLDKIEEVIYEAGGHSWLIQTGSPVGRLSRYPELVIAPDDMPEIVNYIVKAKRRNKVHISVGDNIGYYSEDELELRYNPRTKKNVYFCGCFAGILGVGIESNGNVKGCLSLQDDRFIEGNVREETLTEIWNKEGNFAYTRGFKKDMLQGNCKGCEYGEICRGGCSFMALGTSGKLHSNPYCMQNVSK